jgi:hypothetical protein
MCEKRGKYQVIFDASTQSHQHKLVLNQVTSAEFEPISNFGQSKMLLYINIYNWRVGFLDQVIYLVLANILAFFCFPRIAANLTGAFGFLVNNLYFLSTRHVFGSNTSASSWEPFWRAIQNSIPIYFSRDDLVERHKDLYDAIKWDDKPSAIDLVKATKCKLNQGVINDNMTLAPPSAEVYVNDIMGAAVSKEWILKLLAAIIESIFVVCGWLQMDVNNAPFH